MKNHRSTPILAFLLAVLLLFFMKLPAAFAARPVVRAVLFFSPTCPHCHIVLTETLPPLFDEYGTQLQITTVDITQPEGDALFVAALKKFGLEGEGVPFLVVGGQYLVGSVQIPEELPGLIESYLAAGGAGWPDIPGLEAAMAGSSAITLLTAASSPATSETEPAEMKWQAAFSRDPVGNSLSVVILAGMLAASFRAVVLFRRKRTRRQRSWTPVIPILCAAGLAVAGYLAYVETANVRAVCGPVGDCNTVQQSEYARLFGILPIGQLGIAGYVAILAAWLFACYGDGRTANTAGFYIFLMAAFGTLFSIYLTFLEPFVIGASCAWCLTSAVLMTALMLVAAQPAGLAFSALSGRRVNRRK